jgi:hypothetical protein
MKDVMLDFETLGNDKDKCICQVGALFFNNVTGELGSEFKANIDASTHEKYGGKLDAKTVYWWLNQSEPARQGLLSNQRPVLEVFEELNTFLAPAARIWSHATFDFVILTDTMKQLGITPTFSYKKGLDILTLVYLAKLTFDKTPREGVHHDALDDCKHQVKYCVAALNAVKTAKSLK